MNIKANEKINEMIKNSEKIMADYVSELKNGLEAKALNIDGVEEIMLRAMENFKRGVIAATEEIMSEEGKKKTEEENCKQCGKKMIVNSKSSRLKVKSMLGEVNLHRYLLHCRPCGKGHAPFDIEIGVDEGFKITKKLKEMICDLGQRLGSYKETSQIIDKYFGIKIAASTIQKICEEVGTKVFEREKKEAKYLYENQHKVVNELPEEKKKGRLYIEADGSMVSIRYEGWKEIKLGIVFKDSKIINKDKERHIIIEKEYTAYVGSAEEFKKQLWATAVRNGLEEVKEVVILGDGAQWVWNIAKELFPEAVFILDYYHFSEHVYECANIMYPQDEVNRKRWADGIIDGFMTGKVEETIDSINPADIKDPNIKSKVTGLKTYLENNRNKLHYKEYQEKGYFIGSGAIESGHKSVLQRRLKLPGMRWSRKGVQAMAALRTAHKSDKWYKVTDIIYGKAC